MSRLTLRKTSSGTAFVFVTFRYSSQSNSLLAVPKNIETAMKYSLLNNLFLAYVKQV